MPQESFWFLYIVLHKYLFYLCICQGHKYVEEHRYTFQLLICAAADVAGFDWTNSLPQTAKLLRWIRSSVHVSDCHIGPCVLSIGIGIKWYFLPPPLPEKETHQKKCGRWRGNLRVWLRNEEHSLPTQMWWQPGRDEKPAVPGGPLKSFSNLLLMRRSRAASAHSLHVSLGKPLTETCCTPTSSSTRSHLSSLAIWHLGAQQLFCYFYAE